jgi:hypothetical protein
MMKKMTTILMILLAGTWLMAGSVRAYLSEPEVVEGNQAHLILEATGRDVVFPTIDTIGNYPVEGASTSNQSSIKVINGQVQQEHVRKQTLVFTPEKSMTIPSFTIEVDGQSLETDPVELKVVKSAAPTPGVSKKVTLDMVANKKEVYVGEPLLVSIFFNESTKVNLMKVEYHKPAFKGFFVKEIGDEKTYRKGDYIVHELRYLLTPKQEGEITIPAAVARVAERGRRKDDFFGTFFDVPVWSRVVSNSLQIKVKPLPQDTDLVGDFSLTDEVDATEVKANKPVNLTVTIKGEGNLEDFEGPSYEIDGVTVYSDDAKVESRIENNHFVSTWTKKYVFIADQDFTIPAKSFTEFDYKSGTVKTIGTKAYTITVKGHGAVTPQVVSSPTQSGGEPTMVAQPGKSEGAGGAKEAVASLKADPWMLLLAFGGGIALTLLVLKILPSIRWKRSVNPMKESEALKILYPHTNDDPEVEAMVRKLYAKKGGDKSVVIDKKELKALVDRYREQV